MKTGPATRPIIERLLARIEIDTEAGCWLWQGSTNKGQGQIGSGGYRGRPLGVHVVAWEHYRGPVPEGRKVSQSCGSGTCCNPDHLILRTHGQVVQAWRGSKPKAPRRVRPKMARSSPVERLLARIEIGPIPPGLDSGCWLWPGCTIESGYGRINIAGKVVATHRFVFEFYNGWLPAELDHLCNVRPCCNPDHLEATTHAENIRRAVERGSFRGRGVRL